MFVSASHGENALFTCVSKRTHCYCVSAFFSFSLASYILWQKFGGASTFEEMGEPHPVEIQCDHGAVLVINM